MNGGKGVSYVKINSGRRICFTVENTAELEKEMKKAFVGDWFVPQCGKVVEITDVEPGQPVILRRR
jgi:hypothetical protein